MKKLTTFIALILLAVIAHAQEIKGTYAIKNAQTGLLLRIKDANSKTGTPIVLYEPEDWKCMTWDFKHIDGNTYHLQNLFSGKTMQVTGTSAGSGLDEQPIAAAKSTQLYEFEPVNADTYLIKLKGTDQYITSAPNSRVNTPVILAAKRGDKSQQWSIYQQSPTM